MTRCTIYDGQSAEPLDEATVAALAAIIRDEREQQEEEFAAWKEAQARRVPSSGFRVPSPERAPDADVPVKIERRGNVRIIIRGRVAGGPHSATSRVSAFNPAVEPPGISRDGLAKVHKRARNISCSREGDWKDETTSFISPIGRRGGKPEILKARDAEECAL